MKILYEAVCEDCQEKFQTLATLQEFEQLMIDEKCTNCGGTLHRSWQGSGHYKMATGATRKPT